MSISKFEQSLAAARARGGKKPTPALPVPAKQLSLELWPDAVRGVPNSVLRGALFGVSKVRKTIRRRTLIASTENYEIRFKGETFNQADLDILQGLLHFAVPHKLGTRVEFSVHSFLKEMGRKTAGTQHEQFHDSVERLQGGVIRITETETGRYFARSIVDKAEFDPSSGRFVVVFNEDMLTLYQTGYTLIDWGQRQALGQNSLAKWLHGFYASHAAPYAYKVETLSKLSGSIAELKEYRRLLRAALDKLMEIGALTSWDIDHDSDLVTVSKRPSRSQTKHLTKASRSR